MIQLKSSREIELMSEGGKILGRTIQRLSDAVRPGMSTADLDAVAEEFIRSHDGATPAFKGLYGFPGSICTSLNDEIVHGIPSKKRILREGDIISIDVGVGYRGFFTDSAITVPVGNVDPKTDRLLTVTRQALEAGIAAARVGNHIGDIGAAVQVVVENAGFSVVRDLVGHEAARKARTRAYSRHRADGKRRRFRHAYATRPLDHRHRGRVAIRALRTHRGDHGERPESSYSGSLSHKVSIKKA
jgi:methionyl aminopeptidase